MMVLYPIASSIELRVPLFSSLIWQRYLDFLSSTVHFSTLVQLAASLFISLIYAEISDNLGHGVLLNFIVGKYHRPKEEHRIFLFTDMKDSTSIAEKLGTKKYFFFLRDYYNSLEDAIIKYGGDVYQYIGDEIVITWEYATGIKKNNCLHTFFEMKSALEAKSDFFLNTYGFAPQFKGGMHFGEVTTGEIGALKKEIVFTGDILNTTARIQGACKKYNTDFLVSYTMNKGFQMDNRFKFSEIGEVALRGKEETLTLVKVELT
ncbi:adenylate/guanylate cyclase domain-containing protein [Maribacter litopenaei]|uniref:Adenylate/guanylate cyclase domain-containing protein n=1 Tax=Maribacter litopenaei TaxID=2976127 RepID=A0ABY5Y5S0_9FLAO|nr:adenylate/guanylate cyclase domain-containing protein [Maribacter litopenaei]UWX54382.1 adenylate/guanylate cyclase domain-containing protein [Maribacter litopenaei]